MSLLAFHIANALSGQSTLLSFSTSYAIARSYALSGPAGTASTVSPGFVYEVDLASIVGLQPVLIDPVSLISSGLNGTYSHAHNGQMTLLAQIAKGHTTFHQARQCGGGMLSPSASAELIALINAIRDAEILIANALPATAIIARHPEH